MWKLAGTASLLSVLAGLAFAEPVEMTFSLPAEFSGEPVSWSATPLDLPADADILAAMVMEPDAFAGPWVVSLEPGEYQISAFSENELFELVVTVLADAPQSHEVPTLVLEQTIPFRCGEVERCEFKDDATGLLFALPGGWAAERPYRFDLGGGQLADEISAIFFQDIDSEGADVWFLNPTEWVEDENGPCREVPLGTICSFELTEKTEAAYAIIAPSLRISQDQ